MCSNFAHLQCWQVTQKHNKFVKVGGTFGQINLKEMAQDFLNYSKVEKFRRIWSHCRLPLSAFYFWHLLLEMYCHLLSKIFCLSEQRTLTDFIRGSITVRLTSCLTGLDLARRVNMLWIKHKLSSWILTSITGGQLYRDTSPYEVPVNLDFSRCKNVLTLWHDHFKLLGRTFGFNHSLFKWQTKPCNMPWNVYTLDCMMC